LGASNHRRTLHHSLLVSPDPRIPRVRLVSSTLLLPLSFPLPRRLMRVVPGIAVPTLALAFLRTVSGSLYVVSPTVQTVCHGGQPCSVQWLDDGQVPLLTTMGPCYVALFAGIQELIQQIEPIDVSINHSLTFNPNPKAGPNSNNYYIAFTSIESPDSSHPLQAFSPSFTLDQMSGSFNSPVPELTSVIPAPSSVLTAHPNSVSTSLLYGAVSSTPANPSSLSLPLSPGSSSSQSPLPNSSPVATSSRTNAATRQSMPLWVITLVGLSISFFV